MKLVHYNDEKFVNPYLCCFEEPSNFEKISLYEKGGGVSKRLTRFSPRHGFKFSLSSSMTIG